MQFRDITSIQKIENQLSQIHISLSCDVLETQLQAIDDLRYLIEINFKKPSTLFSTLLQNMPKVKNFDILNFCLGVAISKNLAIMAFWPFIYAGADINQIWLTTEACEELTFVKFINSPLKIATPHTDEKNKFPFSVCFIFQYFDSIDEEILHYLQGKIDTAVLKTYIEKPLLSLVVVSPAIVFKRIFCQLNALAPEVATSLKSACLAECAKQLKLSTDTRIESIQEFLQTDGGEYFRERMHLTKHG